MPGRGALSGARNPIGGGTVLVVVVVLVLVVAACCACQGYQA